MLRRHRIDAVKDYQDADKMRIEGSPSFVLNEGRQKVTRVGQGDFTFDDVWLAATEIPKSRGAMKYVYILESLDSEHFYVGITDDLRSRFAKHNAGDVAHTSKYRPWKLRTYIAFSDEKRAVPFEKYLKSASGRAFAKKRL